MFETKTTDSSTSPPSRGRSPAETDGSAPSRPLSKVRASFVAVERPEVAGQGQQWGLRKASDVSVMADANGPKAISAVIAEDRQKEEALSKVAPAKENMRVDSAAIDNAAPKQEGTGEGGLGAILKGSAFEEPAVEAGAAKKAEPASKMSTKPKSSNNKVTDTKASSSIVKKLDEAKKDPHPPPKGSFVDKDVKSVKPPGGRIHPRISTTAPAASKPSATGPVASKPATTAPAGSKPSPTTPKRPTFPKTTKMASSKPNGATKPADTAETTAEATGPNKDASQLSPKEKPRSSTTKPVRVPEHATSPTAASAGRANGEGKGVANKPSVPPAVTAKETKSAKPEKKETKAPTIAKAITMATAATSSLAKKAPRASLASQANGQDRPKSRTSIGSKAPDESFLARMTRPTTSSASKAHEKVKVDSPPREKNRPSLQKPKTRASLAGGGGNTTVKEAEAAEL